MKIKTFIIGALINIVSGVLFSLSLAMVEMFIPSLFFAGILGGIYVGVKRKRPMINCFYDGFIIGIPSSIILAAIIFPIFWFQGNVFNYNPEPVIMIISIVIGTFALTGIVGSPLGGILTGAYYRYAKKDRGEGELYESYLEEKVSEKDKKFAALLDDG
ncbi:MAG: DUF5518 domain-containing protein [Candidatus Heimdallarchaeota archaeon]